MLLSNFYGGKYIKYEQFGSKLLHKCVRRRWYLKQLPKPEFILHLDIKALNRDSLHVHQNFLGAVFRYLS